MSRAAALAVALGLVLAGCGSSPDAPGGARTNDPPPDQPPAAEDGAAPGVTPDAGTPPEVEPDAGPATDAGGSPASALSDPTLSGPWAPAVRTVTLVDPARGRSFAVDVWYPAASATSGKKNQYELKVLGLSLAAMPSAARRDAEPAAGAWPVVMFSHGFGGIRFQSFFFTEYLASHGFVVVAPDHPGNTLADVMLPGGASDEAAAKSAADRPLDVIFTLDRTLDGSVWPALAVDAKRVATSGHSFGGWTALEVARLDTRVKLVMSMAPGFKKGTSDAFVAQLGRPVALVGGELDETCPFPTDQKHPYEIAASPKLLLEVMGAGHLDFSNLCQVPLAAQAVNDGCDPSKVEPLVVHQRTRAVLTAFAQRHLNGGVDYEPFLEAGFVQQLGGVSYWRDW